MCCARLAWLKGAGRMPVHPLTARVLGPTVVCIVASMVAWAPGISDEGLLIVSAQAQRAQKSPADQLRSQVETLINRLRGRDMPEGIVTSNGRIEATQVDVAAKYGGPRGPLPGGDGGEGPAGPRGAPPSPPRTERRKA